jgi:ATP-binding protein involved in chromosome partitioning
VSLEDAIHQRLEEVVFPGFPHSIRRYGLVQQVSVESGRATITLLPASRRPEVVQAIAERVRETVLTIPGIRDVRVMNAGQHRQSPAAENQTVIPGVARIVAVSSAKGGVGKSTVAVNLAVALRAMGAKVALMDADVYGPSAPMMLGLDARPRSAANKIEPIERYGIDVMSMGFFLDDSSPVIWRGPMVMGLIRQFLRDVDWGKQDYLVIDMPPGTGDAALTLAQQVPITGAVIVTTPQEVALADVERGIAMFRQLQVPVLGVVENMSYYVCPDCGEREELFGSGGGEALAKQFGVPVLAKLPLVAEIRAAGDAGTPMALTAPDHPVSKEFAALARSVDQALAVA